MSVGLITRLPSFGKLIQTFDLSPHRNFVLKQYRTLGERKTVQPFRVIED